MTNTELDAALRESAGRVDRHNILVEVRILTSQGVDAMLALQYLSGIVVAKESEHEIKPQENCKPTTRPLR